jgi:glycerate 2-kinase
MNVKEDAQTIIAAALAAAQPDSAVKAALQGISFNPEGRVITVALGKAAWSMAATASKALGARIHSGLVITKYGHLGGSIPNFSLFEAGHPVPDNNSFRATEEAMRLVGGLSAKDSVLLLISGGGSALFEKPLLPPTELRDITAQLLASGADIREMNTIRKRLSAVKGGRFAELCAPAQVYSVILSDIIGDPLDMIASGPAFPDSSTCEDALRIAKKYSLSLSNEAQELLLKETPKELSGIHSLVTGSVKVLCNAAADAATLLGYRPLILTASLSCQAREAGSFLGSIAKHHQDSRESLAFIAGGETVVKLTGAGKGGRNQELALAASLEISGCRDTAVFSLGSDGTDGPTDAAGGYTDGSSDEKLQNAGFDIWGVLRDNDSYTALNAIGGLLITGPTGTNVNDLSVILIRRG